MLIPLQSNLRLMGLLNSCSMFQATNYMQRSIGSVKLGCSSRFDTERTLGHAKRPVVTPQINAVPLTIDSH